MEQRHDIAHFLDMVHAPAFSVKEGIVDACNLDAQQRLIPTGVPVADLIAIGAEDYEAMNGGCLCLTLECGGITYGASVTKLSGCDVFLLESHEENPDLAVLDLASRELRLPVGELMIHLNKLMPEFSSSNPALAGAVNHSLYKMMRILGNMSNAHRYETASIHAMTECQIGLMLEKNVIREAALLLARQGITLEYSDHTKGLSTLADEEKLSQALFSLIGNAASYTARGGWIRVNLRCTDQRILLSVTDNGSGIPDDVFPTLFSRYQRSNQPEDSRYGIGLGLPIVRQVAFIHGGTALAERPAEGGTRISLSFPIRHTTSPEFRTPEVSYGNDPKANALINLAHILTDEAYKN